jgi:hypothetical protein
MTWLPGMEIIIGIIIFCIIGSILDAFSEPGCTRCSSNFGSGDHRYH